jgi:hypothetical protein
MYAAMAINAVLMIANLWALHESSEELLELRRSRRDLDRKISLAESIKNPRATNPIS